MIVESVTNLVLYREPNLTLKYPPPPAVCKWRQEDIGLVLKVNKNWTLVLIATGVGWALSTLSKKLILNTGGLYVDYYDHHFDLRAFNQGAPVWNRNVRKDFPKRRESLIALEWASWSTPRWGPVAAFVNFPQQRVVVYTDETMHQGIGKELLTVEQARAKHYDELLCTFFVDSAGASAISRRWLAVGHRVLVFEYESRDDWRSNYDTTDIRFVEELSSCPESLRRLMSAYTTPIIAIDCVQARGTSRWLATDLNLAPGMRGSGIEDIISPAECASLIKEKFYELTARR